ncbi:unnamed protein product, partial [Calypogeia fissa]
LNITVYFTYGY